MMGNGSSKLVVMSGNIHHDSPRNNFQNADISAGRFSDSNRPQDNQPLTRSWYLYGHTAGERDA